MSVVTNCTTCGRELRAKDQYAGQRTRCPDCGTINRLPSKPDAPLHAESAPVGTPEGVCRLCGQDFSSNRDRVKDVKGRFYHRRCYETALRHRQAKGDSAPRKTPAASNKAASQGSASPRQRPQGRSLKTAPAPKPPSNVSPASDDLWSELGSPLDSGEALWGDDLLAAGEPLSGGGGLGLAAGAVLQTRSLRPGMETTTKFLIGIGAAVPILLVIAIFISIATRSDRSTQSVATAEPTVESPEPPEAESPPPVPQVHRPLLHQAAPAGAPAREFESPPPVHRPLPHRTTPARAPTRDTPSPEIPTDMIATIAVVLGILAVVLTVILSIAAVTLKAACSVCHVNEPSFGKAVLISLALLIPAPFLTCVPLLGARGTLEQVVFALSVAVACNTAVAGFIYGKCLGTTFGKGVLLCITQVLVLIFVGIVVSVVLFVAGLLFGGIAFLAS